MQGNVLLVEDDASLGESTTLLLEREGLTVDLASDGQTGVDTFRKSSHDLIILDVMLPVLDGFEVCRIIRQESSVPVVMLTALDSTTDLVVGLELGADDFISKPFDGRELVARVRAAMRRSTSVQHGANVVYGDLVLEPQAFIARKNGEPLELSATEFKLLLELSRHIGQVMTRETLLRRVWEYDYMGDSRMVDMAIKRLRLKIEDEGENRYIKTVRGIGYRFDKP